MSKVGLIIKREFVTRVKKRSFLITTVVTPLLLIAAFVGIIFIGMSTGDVKDILVIDQSGYFKGEFEDSDKLSFQYSTDRDLEESKSRLTAEQDELYGLLYIPQLDIDDPQDITFYADGNPSLSVTSGIEKTLRQKIEKLKLERSGISQETIESLKADVDVEAINVKGGEEKKSNAEVTTAIGYAGGFLIYIFIFLYGAQVMRGVIEEKSSRIVEIIISSVRPFQLMVGKIFGVSLVVLAQILIWILVLSLGSTLVMGFFVGDISTQQEMISQGMSVSPEAANQASSQFEPLQDINAVLETVDISSILIGFVIYFFGGYLMYASLFAAVGSAVDSDADSQQFMLPITIPLVFSIAVLGIVLQDPDGPLAFWMSMIPFTSPVVMMMRIPFGVPAWEFALSVGLLIVGFSATTWMAGRIYKVGILMHGTKVTYKTLGKWITMKN